jgi:hypothetical protein
MLTVAIPLHSSVDDELFANQYIPTNDNARNNSGWLLAKFIPFELSLFAKAVANHAQTKAIMIAQKHLKEIKRLIQKQLDEYCQYCNENGIPNGIDLLLNACIIAKKK